MRNGAATIRATLETVIAQTLQPGRIIVVDDGSTDGGAELLRAYPFVDVIVTQARGVSHARNTAIKAARSEYLAFLDCDDLWHPKKLERQLVIARGNPEAAVVTCDHIHVTRNGIRIPDTIYRPRFAGQALGLMLGKGFALGGWSSSMLVRRASLIDSGCFDESLSYFEDLDICLRLARDYTFEPCPEVLVFIVENKDSVMRRSATPEQLVEICLQGLSVMDRWVEMAPHSAGIPRQCARFILSKMVKHGLGMASLSVIRRQMATRTPRLTTRMARSDMHLMCCLLIAAVLDFRKAARALQRDVARRRAETQLGQMADLPCRESCPTDSGNAIPNRPG